MSSKNDDKMVTTRDLDTLSFHIHSSFNMLEKLN